MVIDIHSIILPHLSVRGSYTNLCICIGRGQPDYEATEKCILGEMRYAVYERVFRLPRTSQRKVSPLYLPTPLRYLIASNLAGEHRNPSDKAATAADLIIVKALVLSIHEALVNPNIFKCIPAPSEPSFDMAKYFPLSPNNAQLYIAAIMRVSPEDQRNCLVSLLDGLYLCMPDEETVSTTLLEEHSHEHKLALLSFLASIISVVTEIFIFLTCGDISPRQVLSLVGKAISVPSLAEAQMLESTETSRGFVRIHEDLEALGLGEDGQSLFTNMDDKYSGRLQIVLMRALSLGLHYAHFDQCTLLFSAWQGLGMSDLWFCNPRTVQLPEQSSVASQKLSTLIHELRFDMSSVQRLVQPFQGSPSVLPEIVTRKQSEASTYNTTVAAEVRKMIEKASGISEALLRMDSVSLGLLQATIEIVCVYISFAVASCTRTIGDSSTQFEHNAKRDVTGAVSDDQESDVESLSSLSALTAASRCAHRSNWLQRGTPVYPVSQIIILPGYVAHRYLWMLLFPRRTGWVATAHLLVL